MSTRFRWAAFLLMIALFVGGAWIVLAPGVADLPDVSPSMAPEARPFDDDARPVLAPGGTGNKEAPGAPGDPLADAAGDRADRPRGLLRGVVASGRTHAPVEGAVVVVRAHAGAAPDGFKTRAEATAERRTTTDAHGRFVLADLPVGAWRVSVVHPQEGEARAVGLASPSPPWLFLYPMPRDGSEGVVLVRVIDDRDAAVADVTVRLVCDVAGLVLTERTDGEGFARFVAVPRTGPYATGWVEAVAGAAYARAPFSFERRYLLADGAVVLRLAPAGALAGRIVGVPVERAAGTVVEAWSLIGGRGTFASGVPTAATVDEEGRYRFDALPAGAYTVFLRAGRGLVAKTALDERFSREGAPEYVPHQVLVEPGTQATLDLDVSEAARLEGQVTEAVSGRAVVGARVEVTLPQGPWDYSERALRNGVHVWRLDAPWPDARRHPLTFRVTTTDAAGRYALDGLLAGPYRVTVVAEGALAFERREPVVLAESRTTTLVHVLPEGGALELVAPPFQSLGVRRAGDTTLLVAFVMPRDATGAALVPGLPVGSYELVDVHSDERIPPVVRARFAIRAGATTYLDVSDVGTHRLSLRLLDRGVPVEGARVRIETLPQGSLLTDAEGRVAFALMRYGDAGRTEVAVGLGRPGTPPLGVTLAFDTRVVETDLVLPTGSIVVRAPSGTRVVSTGIASDVPHGQWRTVGEVRAEVGGDRVARLTTLPSGPHRLSLTFPSGAVVERDVEVGDGPVEVAFEEPVVGAIRIRVTDRTGAPRAGIRLSLTSLPDDVRPDLPLEQRWSHAVQRTVQGMRSGADGTLRVPGLAVGLVRVGAWVQAAGPFGLATERAVADATVVADVETEVVLTLAPLEDR